MAHTAVATKRSLVLRRRTGDLRGEAAVLLNLAVTAIRANMFEHVEERLSDALNGIAFDHAAGGAFATALTFHEQALEVAENGHRGSLTGIHNSMGVTLLGLGRLQESSRHHEAARAMAVAAGDRYEQARALSGIAETLAADDPDQARQLWACALTLYEDLKLPAADDVRGRHAVLPRSRDQPRVFLTCLEVRDHAAADRHVRPRHVNA